MGKTKKAELDKVFMLVALGQVYPLADGRGWFCEGVGNVTLEVRKLITYNRVRLRTRFSGGKGGFVIETIEVRP